MTVRTYGSSLRRCRSQSCWALRRHAARQGAHPSARVRYAQLRRELGRSSPLGDGKPGFRNKPAIAFAPDGSLGVTWKSAYRDRGYSFDVWAAVAPRGDTRFLPPVRLNDRTSPAQPCGTGLHGEAYTCDELDWTVLSDSYLYSVWGDGRGGENPWFGRYGYVAVARGRHRHRPHHHRHRHRHRRAPH
jgi:hypothetical protein